MKKLFGTDGMRGIAGEFPLEAETVKTTGRALAAHFARRENRSPRFVTGRDTRASGKWIEQALTDGAREAGAEVVSAGVITTPGVAFLTAATRADAGIVISASHNPFEDNGIKIFTASGRKLDEAIEREIEAAIYQNSSSETTTADSAPPPTPNDNQDLSNATTAAALFENDVAGHALQQQFVDYLLEIADDLRLDKLTIVVDCAHGAAYRIAPQVLEARGARLHIINAAPTGRNINLECGSLHLEALQAAVKEHHADFGVAFDGDADRAMFVDERGTVVDGDATLWILARLMKSQNRLSHSLVVATVMSNLGLEQAFQREQIAMLRANVGDKYVLEKLLERDAALGGEQSGHIIVPRESLVGCGIRTTLHVLQAMSASGEKLSTLASGFARFPQILLNVKVKEKTPFEQVPAIAKLAEQIELELGADGRLLLRYSGTERLARVMVEGKDERQVTSAAHRLRDAIARELGD